jgi:hypothetical protein
LEPVGGDAISDTEELGKYVFIRNQDGWRLQPYDADQELRVIGNIFARDPEGRLWLSRAGRTIVIQSERSALSTAIQQEALEYASYDGGVEVDPDSSYAGTSFPTGTRQAPVNNIDDALTIAAQRGFVEIRFRSDVVLSNVDLSERHVTASILGVVVVLGANVNVDNTRFSDATLVGSFVGTNCHLHRCRIGDITYSGEFVEQCAIMGTITLVGSNNVFILDNVDADPGSGTPTLDLAAFTGALSIRSWWGGLVVQNKVDAGTAALDMNSGRLVVDSSCTGGTIRVRGIGSVEGTTGGTVIDENDLLSRSSMASAIWRELLDDHSAVSGSIAEVILEMADRFTVRDQIVYDESGRITSARERLFPTEVAALAGTGEIVTWGVVFTYVGATTQLASMTRTKQ